MKLSIMAIIIITGAVLAILLSQPAEASASTDNVTDNTSSGNVTENVTMDFYTIVVLPDTQLYSQSYPEVFKAQTQWIVDNQETENIIQVAHVGDVVQNSGSQAEWNRSESAFDILRDNGIPYIVTPGNHDILSENWSDKFNQAAQTDNYSLFSIGGTEIILVSVNGNSGYVEESVNQTIATLSLYPDRRAIVLTHGYIWYGGTVVNLYDTDGPYIWENLVKPSSNIFLTLSGHLRGESWSTDVTDNGTLVNNLMANYQHLESGGQGWMRLYRFSTNMTSIEVKTYSPFLNEYQTDEEDAFTVDLVESKAPNKIEFTLEGYGTLPALPLPPTPPAPALPENTGGFGGGGGSSSGGGGFAGSYDDYSKVSLDGNLTLSIPSGVVVRNADGKLIPPYYVYARLIDNPPASLGNVIGLPYEMYPSGATFDPPIPLTFKLPAGVSGNLAVAYWDGSRWVTVGGVVDMANHTITVKVSHFSVYAVVSAAPVVVTPEPVKPTPKPAPAPKRTPKPEPAPEIKAPEVVIPAPEPPAVLPEPVVEPDVYFYPSVQYLPEPPYETPEREQGGSMVWLCLLSIPGLIGGYIAWLYVRNWKNS